MDGNVIALGFALTSVPAFLVAQSLARGAQRRDPDRAQSGLARTLARCMRIVGGVMLAGAAAMLWSGGDPRRTVMVVLGVALLVNAMAVVMLVAVVRRRRG
jgi:hypothetical protein